MQTHALLLPEPTKPVPDVKMLPKRTFCLSLLAQPGKKNNGASRAGFLEASRWSVSGLRDGSPGMELLGCRALWLEVKALSTFTGAAGDRLSTVPSTGPGIHSFLPWFTHSFICRPAGMCQWPSCAQYRAGLLGRFRE